MVDLMLGGLGGDCRNRTPSGVKTGFTGSQSIQCYHVNAQFSDGIEEVGVFQIRKLFRIFRFCMEAIWCRIRYRADVFYYIPAPPRRVPFFRDCVVLLLCRPFFKRIVYHWAASGLSDWLKSDASFLERWLARLVLSHPDLSLVLAESRSDDATYFRSRRICVTPNGIRDPCPEFETLIRPNRLERLGGRRKATEPLVVAPAELKSYRVIFLAHCTRDKGLFDSIEAIGLANQQLKNSGSGVRMHLTVAGAFPCQADRDEFENWHRVDPDHLHYAGFLDESAKNTLLAESDCLCFPSYYFAETQPVAIIEAMAFGLSVVATAWRGIPEMLPTQYPHLVPIRDPVALAQMLLESMESDWTASLRHRFCENFTDARYIERLEEALQSLAS